MKNIKKMRIAIDGGAGSGKTSIAKGLAKKLEIEYISTGLMYRVLTILFCDNDLLNKLTNDELIKSFLSDYYGKISYDNETILLNNKKFSEKELHSEKVSENINKITGLKTVRDFCKKEQTRIATKKGILLEGRDITSVIMTDADVKFFIYTDQKIKAKRRLKHLEELNIKSNFDDVYDAIVERDFVDTNRKIAPLIKVEDAIFINNENLSLNQIIDKMYEIVLKISSLKKVESKDIKRWSDEN